MLSEGTKAPELISDTDRAVGRAYDAERAEGEALLRARSAAPDQLPDLT